MPFTYPRTPNGLLTYDHKLFETEETSFGNSAFNPQFEFGQGLSYTTFAYSNLQVSPKTVPMNGQVSVSVTVANTGQRAGKDAVLLYVRDVAASITPACAGPKKPWTSNVPVMLRLVSSDCGMPSIDG